MVLPKILKNKLLVNTSIYMGFSVLEKAVPFLLLPLLTVYLTPEDYGIISMFQIVLSVMISLVGVNLSGAVAVQYFKLDSDKFAVYTGNTIIIVFSSFILFIVLTLFFGSSFEQYLNISTTLILIAVTISFVRYFFNIVIVRYQVEEKPMQYGLLNLVRVLSDVSLSVLLIVVFSYSWVGRIAGITISSFIVFSIAIYKLLRNKEIVLSFNKLFIKDQLKFGIPLIFATLSGIIITSVDRIFINNMIDISTVGIYTVGLQISMIISFIGASFNQAWVPYLFSKLKDSSEKEKINLVKFSYVLMIFFVLLAFGFSYFASIFINVFIGKEFISAKEFVIWLSFAFAFDSCRYLVINYFYYVNKTYISASIFIVVALINVILNYYFIQLYGAIGASKATFIAMLLNFLLTWGASYFVFPMPWFSKTLFVKKTS